MAEDLVQETFLSAIQSWDSYQGRSSVRTWLTGILKNKILDYYRKRWREVQVSKRDSDRDSFEDEWEYFNSKGMWQNNKPQSWPDAKEALEEKEFWKMFKQCNDGLSDRLRELFTLRELENLGREKICQVLNISVTNYWKMMQRARSQLRQCLEKHWFGRSL